MGIWSGSPPAACETCGCGSTASPSERSALRQAGSAVAGAADTTPCGVVPGSLRTALRDRRRHRPASRSVRLLIPAPCHPAVRRAVWRRLRPPGVPMLVGFVRPAHRPRGPEPWTHTHHPLPSVRGSDQAAGATGPAGSNRARGSCRASGQRRPMPSMTPNVRQEASSDAARSLDPRRSTSCSLETQSRQGTVPSGTGLSIDAPAGPVNRKKSTTRQQDIHKTAEMRSRRTTSRMALEQNARPGCGRAFVCP